MKINMTNDCGNSPRSKLSADIAVALMTGKNYDDIESLLADDFVWITPESQTGITKGQVRHYLSRAAQSGVAIERLDILTSFSHGKYAAVSSFTSTSNNRQSHSHDLYEYTSAGKAAKLRKITSYIVDVV